MAMKSSILFNILFTASVPDPRHLIRRAGDPSTFKSTGSCTGSSHTYAWVSHSIIQMLKKRTRLIINYTWKPSQQPIYASPQERHKRQSTGCFFKAKTSNTKHWMTQN